LRSSVYCRSAKCVRRNSAIDKSVFNSIKAFTKSAAHAGVWSGVLGRGSPAGQTPGVYSAVAAGESGHLAAGESGHLAAGGRRSRTKTRRWTRQAESTYNGLCAGLNMTRSTSKLSLGL
jgi:hypothetical protein